MRNPGRPQSGQRSSRQAYSHKTPRPSPGPAPATAPPLAPSADSGPRSATGPIRGLPPPRHPRLRHSPGRVPQATPGPAPGAAWCDTRRIRGTAGTARPATPVPVGKESHRNVTLPLPWAPRCGIAVLKVGGRAHHPPRTPSAHSTTARPFERHFRPASMAATADPATWTLAHRLSPASASTHGAAG
jgi:hypothetical protein